MTEVDAHELARSFDCKTPDCDRAARSRVGRYSYCDFCREQRAKSVAGSARSQPSDGFEAKAKRLIQAGKKLDKARADATVAMDRVRAAQAEWDAATAAVGGQAE